MSLESNADPDRSPDQRSPRLLDDPLAIRALAHPLRLELSALIGRTGRMTAAEAARQLGISQALASHHLRQLGKYGFVEQVEGDDHRARPWRLTSTSTEWPGQDATPEARAAGDVLDQLLAEQALARLLAWQQRRADWPQEWGRHTGIGRSTVYLTLEEFDELSEAIEGLIARYVDERPIDDIATRPEGSVPVDFTLVAVPVSRTPEGD